MFRLFLTLPILLTACLKDESVSGYAVPEAIYVLQELDAAAFTASASLQFPGRGQVTGKGPCNGFRATQTLPYPWIEIQDLVATKRACPDLTAEATYFAALQAMTLAEVLGPVLILSNDGGRKMVFRAQN
jgi:heat shock protein HslJ